MYEYANLKIGTPLPPDDAHAISVSLPTWKDVVGWVYRESWALSQMTRGYPRFFVHNAITDFASAILVLYGDTKEHGNEEALLFPSSRTAKTCVDFVNYFSGIAAKGEEGNGKNVVRILELATRPRTPWTTVFAVVYPARDEARAAAKAFWQHVGEGLSTRQTATCRQLFNQGLLVLVTENDGDGIFSQAKAVDSVDQLQCQDATTDVDASKEKLQIRQRIAALVEHDTTPEITAKDVYLYPSGMSALFNIHRTILGTLGRKDCICFGFPYVDTLKILSKLGPKRTTEGCLFYGLGTSACLDDLEQKLQTGGNDYVALFCELASNPLLRSPDLARISELAAKYDLAVVVDDTVATAVNVDVFAWGVDVVCTSLSKSFSGACNVMGGSIVLNPNSRYYSRLGRFLAKDFEDIYFPSDAITMELNSRTFIPRVKQMTKNGTAIAWLLETHPSVQTVYFPSSKCFYEQCRRKKSPISEEGGYGFLLTIKFFSAQHAVTFFDALEVARGPSLGTNFTLSCPTTIMAHANELDWVAEFGVDESFVRISAGIEDTAMLLRVVEKALKAVDNAGS